MWWPKDRCANKNATTQIDVDMALLANWEAKAGSITPVPKDANIVLRKS